jgi:hypothetical protein
VIFSQQRLPATALRLAAALYFLARRWLEEWLELGDYLAFDVIEAGLENLYHGYVVPIAFLAKCEDHGS